MAIVTRSIVHIDEELCTGCGLCVLPCAEGAIEIVDGKAKVVKDELCDGAGFCLAVCPEGALTVEHREAPAFDADAAAEKTAARLTAGTVTVADLLQLRAQRDGQPAAAGAYRGPQRLGVRQVPAAAHP
jgi:MinD superfamily P-loop ATPase